MATIGNAPPKRRENCLDNAGYLGRHILVEMYRCDKTSLNDPVYLEETLSHAAHLAGASIVSRTFHHFAPYGVSGVIVISESHLTIHTWPEYGYASLDLYTCGNDTDSRKAFDYIHSKIGAQHTSTVELRRGNLGEIQNRDGPQSAQKIV